MNQVIPAKIARQKFSDLLNEAAYGGKKFTITRSGKPLAILVGITDYNPKDFMTNEEWEAGFKIFDRIRSKGKNLTEKQVEKLVEEAIAWARGQKKRA